MADADAFPYLLNGLKGRNKDAFLFVPPFDDYSLARFHNTQIEDLQCWRVKLSMKFLYEMYRTIPVFIEAAIVGIDGDWATLHYDTDHCVVGGDEKLIAEVAKLVPSREDQIVGLVETWEFYCKRYGYVPEWIAPLIDHILGAGECKKYLAGTCMAGDFWGS